MHLTDKENAAFKACNGVFVFEYIPVGSMEFMAYLPAWPESLQKRRREENSKDV